MLLLELLSVLSQRLANRSDSESALDFEPQPTLPRHDLTEVAIDTQGVVQIEFRQVD